MFGSIQPDIDYPGIVEGVKLVESTLETFKAAGCRLEMPHHHRLWEYGSAVQLALGYKPPKGRTVRVLNVGSGWDALGPALANVDLLVTECEPAAECRANRSEVNIQLAKTKHRPIEILDAGVHNLPDKLYDLVYCISVLEHVHDELNAWKRLAERVILNGILFITVDCVPEGGKPYVFDNLRVTKYTLEMLKERVDMLVNDFGMSVIGTVDYQYHGDHVYNYSFFRVGLTRTRIMGDKNVQRA